MLRSAYRRLSCDSSESKRPFFAVDDDEDDRRTVSTWGFSRPQTPMPEHVGAQTQGSPKVSRLAPDDWERPGPLPPGPNGLRPLRLVLEMEARRAQAQSATELAYLAPAPQPAPEQPSKLVRRATPHPKRSREPSPVPPQSPPPPRPPVPAPAIIAWPEPAHLAYPAEQDIAVPKEFEAIDLGDIPMQAMRASVHYDINDRYRRARREPEEPLMVPPRRSSLPQQPRPAIYLPLEQQHAMALDAFRAQGSWLPDLINQARRGHPLAVPNKNLLPRGNGSGR